MVEYASYKIVYKLNVRNLFHFVLYFCIILICRLIWWTRITSDIFIMGVGPSAILGSTNKFFMPWLVPRNQKDTVYAPSIFGKLSTGRKRREIETAQVAQEVISCKSIKL